MGSRIGSRSRIFSLLRVSLALPTLVLSGCFGPDYNAIANRLRETNIKQQHEITSLQGQLRDRDATIATLRQHPGDLPAALSSEKLDQIFTVSRVEIRSTSDTYDAGDGKGVSAFRVYIRMYAKDGQLIPATGNLTIEAFELPAVPSEPRRIGTWKFTPAEMKKSWYSGFGLDHFALTCPWQTAPHERQVIFRAHFEDLLTGNVFEGELTKKLSQAATNKS